MIEIQATLYGLACAAVFLTVLGVIGYALGALVSSECESEEGDI